MADVFENEPIPVDRLPRLSDDAFVPVDPRYLRSSLAAIGFVAVIVVIASVFLGTQVERPLIVVLIASAVLMLLAVVGVWTVFEVRRLAYQLREHDISVRRGVMTRSVETVPFARVQHVRVNRGPFERSWGLATLQVSSAGPDISIPGLAVADADRMKLLVTERANVLDDTADPP